MATVDKFLDVVKRSGLIEPPRLNDFLAQAAENCGGQLPDDQDELARLLIEERLLTEWQAEKLLAGKHKGFLLGKYKLLGQLGKGGMSSVYLAEHMLMKRFVAIKVLPQNRVEDATYLDRFQLEARAAARLDDPNIVRAYDIDNEGKTHYLVMEYVDGKDLHVLVNEQGPLDFEKAADYIAQVSLGLQHAHEMGLVHRDIKPANCLVDRAECVKLLDMGLAKLAEDEVASLTLANEENVLGTADYLAPEQALDSHSADARSDIYSLGCTFYFLLTGKPPFPEGTISERLLKHQVETPPSIHSMRPEAPPTLINICERMMRKRPDERYQTAGDVAERLTEWLADRGKTVGASSASHDVESGGVGSDVIGRVFRAAIASPPAADTDASGSRDTSQLDDSAGESGSALTDDIGLAPLDDEVEGVPSDVKKKHPSGSGASLPTVAADRDENAREADVLPTAAGQTPPPPPNRKSLLEEEFERLESDPLFGHPMYRPFGETPVGRRQGTPVWLFVAVGVGVLLLIAMFVMLLFSPGS